MMSLGRSVSISFCSIVLMGYASSDILTSETTEFSPSSQKTSICSKQKCITVKLLYSVKGVLNSIYFNGKIIDMHGNSWRVNNRSYITFRKSYNGEIKSFRINLDTPNHNKEEFCQNDFMSIYISKEVYLEKLGYFGCKFIDIY